MDICCISVTAEGQLVLHLDLFDITHPDLNYDFKQRRWHLIDQA